MLLYSLNVFTKEGHEFLSLATRLMNYQKLLKFLNGQKNKTNQNQYLQIGQGSQWVVKQGVLGNEKYPYKHIQLTLNTPILIDTNIWLKYKTRSLITIKTKPYFSSKNLPVNAVPCFS